MARKVAKDKADKSQPKRADKSGSVKKGENKQKKAQAKSAKRSR